MVSPIPAHAGDNDCAPGQRWIEALNRHARALRRAASWAARDRSRRP